MQDHDAAVRPGRHRARTRFKKLHVLALTGLAVLGVGITAGTASADPTPQDWANIRQCESGGDYSINTGNGYYGAYQFDLGTWESVGGSGLPSNASPAEQDMRALMLWRSRGWSPWACASLVSLSNGTSAPSSFGTTPAPAVKSTPYAQVSASSAARWTEQVYRRVLLRGGAGNPFAAALTSGQASYKTVSDFIAVSRERLNRIVDVAYLQCLGRHADAGGLNAYVGYLRNHDLGSVYVSLCSSSEAFNRAHGNTSTWYANVFGSLTGLGVRSPRLAATVGARTAAVRNIVVGSVFENRQLDGVYLAVLGRHADSAGRAAYSSSMSGRGIFTVITALTTSHEFLAMVKA